MKYILLIIILLMLNACGGGGGNSSENNKSNINDLSGDNNLPDDIQSFILQNVRFDAKIIMKANRLQLQKLQALKFGGYHLFYRIDLYLSTNAEVHSDRNEIVSLRCGNLSFSICPNTTSEVQCIVDDNTLSCFLGDDFLGNELFQPEEESSLSFIIKGCDAVNYCYVKAFDLLVQNTRDE